MSDLVFRALFAIILGVATTGPLRELNTATSWRAGTIGARIGDFLTPAWARIALFCAVLLSGGAFAANVLAPVAVAVMTAGFLLLATVYLSQEFAGYVTEEDDGSRHFKVHHHLHLLGMAALAITATGLCAAAAGYDATSHRTTVWMAQGLWGTIPAHYFVSAVSKIRKRGLRWPDPRLFPFYVTLFARFEAGDGKAVRQTGPGWALARRPRWGVVTLWAALLLELATPLALLGTAPRAVICVSLLLFHLSSLWVLSVDFRENAMLVALAVLPFPFVGGAWTDLGPQIPAVVVFAVATVLSLAFDDRVYPFSNLPMFAAAYRPSPVVTLRSPDGSEIYPTPDVANCSTSGLSREYSAAESSSEALDAFVTQVGRRNAAAPLSLPEGATLWVEIVDVDPAGTVHTSQRRLCSLLPSAAGDR
ncbi:hypothetical protein OG413_36045 [Streptomyces sp. NBC_01433]|uniref:hypothetical protein n=1 Tax=Streptomyces sp. NBC_01433 TaxID=2903864 RepID=UPI0022571963|nr:hypothetical protein [Streptomyces sp. NBC_01433]MCX4680627.1 hypothetical protein [Streptomyces sp. NBC_01433]